jgi:hypothetical protein
MSFFALAKPTKSQDRYDGGAGRMEVAPEPREVTTESTGGS